MLFSRPARGLLGRENALTRSVATLHLRAIVSPPLTGWAPHLLHSYHFLVSHFKTKWSRKIDTPLARSFNACAGAYLPIYSLKNFSMAATGSLVVIIVVAQELGCIVRQHVTRASRHHCHEAQLYFLSGSNPDFSADSGCKGVALLHFTESEICEIYRFWESAAPPEKGYRILKGISCMSAKNV